MKTATEILAKIEASKDDDFFGACREELLASLSFADAKPLLKDGATEAEWETVSRLRTNDDVIAAMRDYMEFALGKATGHRGLSAGRSIDHYRGWLWLLGRDAEIDWDEYAQYGMPILKRICDLFGFPFPAEKSAQRMAAGQPCHAGCDGGCDG